MPVRILLLGGYGVFGGRLAELLADIDNIDLLICGRSLAKATDFCTRYRGKPGIRPLELDRAGIKHALETQRPDLVVDASGPFQNYGSDPYGVIRACIASGTDYLDFADASDFVFGVSQFDLAAKAAGVSILSGVSSFPVLTAAVLREMAKGMDVVTVEGGIAPSPYAGIGINVMRAVVGYAGAPVTLLRNGTQVEIGGLTESLRYTIGTPGRLPLKNTLFSLVDVPDLQVIPPEHAMMRNIWMGAGPRPEFLHRILNLLAKARATLGLPSFARFSGVFYRVLNRMRFGEHRGGMFIRATGLRDGAKVERSWHLLAEGDDGPYIPSMAIEALIRKRLAGTLQLPGARPATHALELADYEALFSNRSIYAGFRESRRESDPIYRQVLGTAFDALAPDIKEFHDGTGAREWSGTASVTRGNSWFALAVCKFFRFPTETARVSVRVRITPTEGKEIWQRTFGPKTFSSVQWCGEGRDDLLLMERFGPIAVALALIVEENRLRFIPRNWYLLGARMPRLFMPGGLSFEAGRNGRFCFDVEIRLPVFGLIVAYKGELDPARENGRLRDMS